MGSVAERLLWAWVVLDLGRRSVSLPDITDAKFIEECVREHNRARSSVSPPASNMLYMTWDDGLARTARGWARRCVFDHNPDRTHPSFPSVGENIWTGLPPSSFDVTGAIKGWVDEKQHYDYTSRACTKVCGHYTQVVWARSYKVGCAVQLCPNGVRNFASGEGAVFVCNYAPAGNVNGMRPYENRGAPCSGCNGTCERNLCRSRDRDSKRRYSGPPDFNYLYVLTARLVALIFTFITAYAVRHFYPDVFCYE